MKILIATVLLALSAHNAASQIAKSYWMLGGDASFSHTNYNSLAFNRYKNSTLTLSPDVGYFFADKFCAGLRVTVLIIKDTYPENQGNGTISYANKSRFYNLGPFARYYFLSTENPINIFAEGFYQYQIRNDVAPNSSTTQNGNSYGFKAGPVFFLNSSVGLELTVGYSSVKYQSITGRDNTLQTSIGLQIHLEKELDAD